MQIPRFTRRFRAAGVLLAVGLVGTGIFARQSVGSDHVDTAEVELSPQLDINDVYAFPGSTDGRIVLVLDVASPINAFGRNVRGFDPNALYQFKIDNNGDAKADLVLQFLFDEMTDGSQRVNVLGPAAPVNVNGSEMLNRLVAGPVSRGNPFNQAFTTANGMQVFTGPRADPFYIDFEQFVRIIPDRRPAALQVVNFPTQPPQPQASAFRPACPNGNFPANPAPFDANHGCATDIFAGANTLSIVVEMPESMLGAGTGVGDKLGIWATIGR